MIHDKAKHLYFQTLLHTALALYFGQECPYSDIRDIPHPKKNWLTDLFDGRTLAFEEEIVVLLALMPHLSPESLDLFFVQYKDLDRPYTEFSDYNGVSHGVFCPFIRQIYQ